MSPPTTPIRSRPSSSISTSQKRDHTVIKDFFGLLATVDDEEPDPDTLAKAAQMAKAAAAEWSQLTFDEKVKLTIKVRQASTLKDVTFVTTPLGITYHNSEEFVWEEPQGPEVKLSEDAESLSARIRRATFWNRESAENLSRILIDIVLFDRLEAHQEDLAAKNLSIRGEVSIDAKTRTGNKIITGVANYVLGYDPIEPSTPDTFEGISIVVEAKKSLGSEEGDGGLAQAVVYMSGIQQQRRMRLEEPARIVDTTYGIFSNGIFWQFMRLDGKRLLVSGPQTTLTQVGRRSVYRFVDTIIKSSVDLSLQNPDATPECFSTL
ncbi:hypothetical protein B7463_g3709, partial [Scytalidium lignicola]